MAARPAARRRNQGQARLAVLGACLCLTWLGLGYRLFDVQVVQAAEYGSKGLEQRVRTITLEAPRGTIFDRNLAPLAITVDSRAVYAVPAEMDDPLYATQVVAALTGQSVDKARANVAKSGSFAYLARRVDPSLADQVIAQGLKGVYVMPEPMRAYPAGALAASVVGLVTTDDQDQIIGLEGLELVYDEELSGKDGVLEYEAAAAEVRAIPQAPNRREVAAVRGSDLISTIDSSLQYIGYDVCRRRLEVTGAIGCSIVVLDVESGEILALVEAPAFDPVSRTVVEPVTEEQNHYSNISIRSTYEPGSVQKLITIASAIDTGTVDIDTVIPQVADRIETTSGACLSPDDDINGCFKDSTQHATEDMTVREIFIRSSNVGTIKVQQRVGHEQLGDYMTRFGLGQLTGVDFNGEAAGSFQLDPSCSSCQASAAIGYSVAVTPLQMAAAYAAIANDGVWTRPSLVKAMIDENGNTTHVTPQTHRVVSERTAWVMRQILADVVTDGTGSEAKVEGYRVGGKTGTALKLGADGKYTEVTRASFVGMAPIDDPKIVVAVLIDEPAYEFRYGGAAAAPAFAEVMEAALNQMGVIPDAVAG